MRIRSKEDMEKPPSTPPTPARRTREIGSRDFELFDELLPVRRYKLLLQTFLNRRGSGSRQAIAEALGNTRSFVTQMTSPAYDLAIPAQHVRRLIELARLDADERRMFIDAYIEAHPERARDILDPASSDGARALTISVPVLRDARAQYHLEQAIERVAAELVATFLAMEKDGTAPNPPDVPEGAA